MALHPNSELVAVGWLQGIPYLGSRVATSLPTDNSTWSASGFVTAVAAGGAAPMYSGQLREPVIGVTCWAAAPTSGKPQWYMASQLVEAILDATLEAVTVPRRLTLPAAYAPAFVRSVRVVSEPTRVPGDVASYARYNLDMVFSWVEVPA